MASAGAGPRPSKPQAKLRFTSLDIQTRYYDAATAHAKNALDAEEASPARPQDAVRFYAAAHRVLSEALRFRYAPRDHTASQAVEAKMQRLLQHVEQRMAVLSPPRSDPTTAPPSWTDNISAFFSSDKDKGKGKDAKLDKEAADALAAGSRARRRVSPPQPASRASGGRSSGDTASMLAGIKGVDKALAMRILNDVVDTSPGIAWDDVAGLEQAKRALFELAILPNINPDLFTGLRAPPRGMLLFGPPGNGKTMIAKAVASEASCRFFSVSAASLTSKWVGESEKMVRALFQMARALQPSIIFIDEVDSLLSMRSSQEQDSSRRLKTEFLVQFDGVTSNSEDRILVIGATNLPEEIDEAMRRRFAKRIYIPMPDVATRLAIIKHLMSKQDRVKISATEMREIAERAEGYSGSDINLLCREASMGPIRELGPKVYKAKASQVRPITVADFQSALKSVRPSVSLEQLAHFEAWNKQFGSYSL